MITPEDLPSVNATLNGASACLLTLGYAAVRRRWLRLHAACMLTALGVSSVFLASYLYYHLVVRHGESTPFLGEGWVRPVYYTVLLTHMALAAVVPPLALATIYQALRSRFAQHVRLARWTLPIWLYVSVTGVLVYWMLYHLFAPG
jgi:putative membrane protein